ncbi:beta-ketoacyl synthase domain-containing protein [Pseudovirgaria hyperparasitica]|uniref:Beta-ketoacyl synthase domain-containing protein n=1 Tax=Pseudovirgaria hyperparasitica TaxID=470096 RepID=A0A6A6WIF2_9PEZI|nr:beta-ketoacyl synthase domain-containing protein [Pseudovirgaria hyperparasitica]KAF2761850.1 beta-ketoacyl synthase domain-containing protein [Pseudovirgaria hyperparasitica]
MPHQTSTPAKGVPEPIAIIGSGCRFPGGASSPSKLWDLLREPRDVLNEIPPSRFDTKGFYHPNSNFPGHANVRHSYLLEENVADFDAQFFGFKQAEASAMDPQQRILLEVVYEALEASGLTIQGLKGSQTGVYCGMMYGDYESLQYRDLQSVPTYHGLGIARSIVSNRVSYFFDWHGPSWTVDTACSSSLVALHSAVQALRSGEVPMAVAAGTNLLLGPEPYIYESNLQMLSPDGRSRMWDQDANGYARGDGVACIVVKTLSQALADGDHIEAIIRETGVNSDGRSPGITMPTMKAQVALIKETYARAGLDITSAKDRCQFFEAHGTGTPAGDPIEAEAVHTAFFGHLPVLKDNETTEDQKESLLVGSIKTVIGHTESTAGIAGILKAVQAIKHGYVPPNMHFKNLSSRVAPFYNNLQIPTELTPWPQLEEGLPRRVSVNSFGFGGTNAHVILESFDRSAVAIQKRPLFSPFVFSAQSKQALAGNFSSYMNYLDQHPDVDASDLAWMLRSRRSHLPLRVSFPASSTAQLQATLEKLTANFQLEPKTTPVNRQTKLLGIFTGQGAQWPRMGAQLIEQSQHASNILAELDQALAELPLHRPTWTLREEILADAASSNVMKASVSQPLCNAVQILLVDLLKLAGIEFSVIVGHSGGEIACAYAAGKLSARDAIRIAYYRGLHSNLACGQNGVQGAMIAVGTTLEDAEELCSDEVFEGRIKLAACNSPSSMTLSGDEDAIDEAIEVLKDEKKFVRKLRVDKGYHSHHMIPCAEEYLKSMKSISIDQTRNTNAGCTWVSSVFPDQPWEEMGKIDNQYWVDNLLSPVLFKQAIERAASLGPFDAAIEIGPHPSLKGPVRETLQDLKVEIAYTGTLKRGESDIASTSETLGYLWTQLDHLDIDFDRYESTLTGGTSHDFLSDLPLYQWNHTQSYWHESNQSKNLRRRSEPVHPLLGDLLQNSTANNLTWKNFLRPQDLPWIHEHQIQGQSVFPAAGYASTAIDSARYVVPNQSIKVIELEGLTIHQAMVFDSKNEESGIEVQFTVFNIDRESQDLVTARFTYECYDSAGSTELVASGKLIIVVGEDNAVALPADNPFEAHMLDVSTPTFYKSLKDVGYDYTGTFQALDNLKRKLGKASGSLAIATTQYEGGAITIHPGVLDASFHSILLAYSYPGDGQLWSLHLPTSIRRIRVDVSVCENALAKASQVSFVATIPDVSTLNRASGFGGDVEIHSPTGDHSAIQVEGLRVVPMAEATSADDKKLFYSTKWVEASPTAEISHEVFQASDYEMELAEVLERGHYFYLRQLEHQIPSDHPGRTDEFNAAYLNWATHTHKLVSEDRHPYGKRDWINDNEDQINALAAPFSDRPEIKAMKVVGEQMPRAIRGETSMLEHLIPNILTDYYTRALGLSQVSVLAETVQQIVRRYPQAKILEVGAGTGGATRQVLKHIGNTNGDELAQWTYTYTDVSAGFFEDAQEEFHLFLDQMSFRVFDLERDAATQGFETGSYDIVVASLVLHTTKSLEETCRRVRSLLKPGGFLVFYEITNTDLIRHTGLFGCLPGWWAGLAEGRTLIPAVDESEWDSVLRKTGFSGVDTMSPLLSQKAFCNSVLVSQAIDHQVEALREPLMAQPSLHDEKLALANLYIVGGSTLRTSRLIEEIQRSIHSFCNQITKVKTLDSMKNYEVVKEDTVLVLQDLDQPVFKDITTGTFDAVKDLFGSEKNIVWVTQNRLTDNPYSNIPAGFARPSVWETPELRYQFIDFQNVQKINARVLTEAVLRFQTLGSVHEPSLKNVLWSVETEIIIDDQGREWIPRLQAAERANKRYNSALRPTSHVVRPQNQSVAIAYIDNTYKLVEAPAKPASGKSESIVSLQVSHSSLHAIRTEAGNAFVVIGTLTTSPGKFIALSTVQASVVHVQKDTLVPITDNIMDEALLTQHVAAQLLQAQLIGSLEKGEIVLVHNATTLLVSLLRSHADRAGAKVFFTTTSPELAKSKGYVYLDKYLRQSQIKSLLPSEVTRFIDFDTLEGTNSHSSSILTWIPRQIQPVRVTDYLKDEGSPILADDHTLNILSQAVEDAERSMALFKDTIIAISVADLPERIVKLGPLTIVDWNATSVTLSVQTVKPRIRPDRTYWMVGLSRDMGLSLADYLIDNGAKHLVITSRSPHVDPTWLANAERKGANVRIISCDVTDFNSLKNALSDVERSMPPVAGVAQGAMVLRDVLTREMKLEELNDVLRPKVDGSLNLDRLFSSHKLDFFVFFSSAAAITGNAGQANYAAANFFMMSLAKQRRGRGLPASVMDLGPILGTGYVTREIAHELARPLQERGLMALSERDIHQIFAEAINASTAESDGEEAHMTTGLTSLPATAPNRPLWYNYAQFGCLTVRDSQDSSHTTDTQAGLSIKDRLAAANSSEDVEVVIRESFIEEMRNMLHLSEDYAITPAVRTDELGLDSLVAVRIRSWFLKHFQVNIPALRIMKGAALQELVDFAVTGTPTELTPLLAPPAPSEEQISAEDTTVPSSTQVSSGSSGSSSDAGETTNTTVQNSVADLKLEKSGEDSAPQPEELNLTRFGRLSYTQSSFMFVHELLPDKTTLNNTGMVALRGELRMVDLGKAVQAIGERHEILRTCICVRDGRLVQGVVDKPTLKLEYKRIRTRQDLDAEYAALRNHAFDLASGQNTRMIIFSHSARDHYFALSTHHMFFDRASTDIFMADLERIYNKQKPTVVSPLQYLDFAEDQHTEAVEGRFNNALAYWRTEFETLPETLPLHRSKVATRSPMEQYKSWTPELRIDPTLAAKVRQIARKHRSTPFHFHLAAIHVLLFRWLGTEDVCIGMADGGRRDEQGWSALGPFLNMLPLRLRSSAQQVFSDSIVQARDKAHSALNSAVPWEMILDELNVERPATHSPIAQAFINYAETSVESGKSFLGCDMKLLVEDQAEMPYDYAFTIINNTAGETRIVLNVQKSLYSEDDATLLAHGYEDIIREFAAAPESAVGSTFKFREVALQDAIRLGPSFTSSWPQTLSHQFDEISHTIPEKVAVTDDEGHAMTYPELSRCVDHIASALLVRNINPGDRVAVFQHPSIYWAASVLAILKVGAVYVPLDAATPVARLSLIVNDSDPAAILVHEQTKELSGSLRPAQELPIIDVSNLNEEPKDALPILATPESAAIILYTSGSTGTPKGVVLSHASLKHEFDHCAATYGLGPRDVVLQQSAWSFDLSVTQLFMAVTVGARLHSVSHLVRPDARRISDLIQQEGISTTYATPTEYRGWLRHQQSLKDAPSWNLALVAGEAVTEPLLEMFRDLERPDLRLFNVYGPTETCCGSTKFQLDYKTRAVYGSVVPVGPASANECFYIVDEGLNLQPVGQSGEILIGGVGVALEYLNNPERTAASFLEDGFSTHPDVFGGRKTAMIYRTGDVGFLQSDGTLVLKGRIGGDTEIKLNGVRIDLQDIEQTVLRASLGRLSDAVASLRTTSTGAGKYMVVFVICSSSVDDGDRDAFVANLLRNLPLPRNMLPSTIIPVQSLPRTLAGKLDRKAVADIQFASQSNHDVTLEKSTMTKNEERCRDLWTSVIPGDVSSLHRITKDSDFFSVGGSSMQLIELQHKFSEELQIKVSLLELMKSCSLREMARLLGGESVDQAPDTSSNEIDWDAETSLDPGLDAAFSTVTEPQLHGIQPVSNPPSTIILTGATGFLGQHILHSLLQDPNINAVICVANRLSPARKALFSDLSATYPNKTIEALEGDLRSPLLGLESSLATRIFDTADAVIHNGADVSHLKTYPLLRAANVESTKILTRLCAPRRIPLHYISTAGVVMYSGTTSIVPTSVRNTPPPTTGTYGYIASKWASEVYLERATNAAMAAGSRMPVFIHRPSSILRPEDESLTEGESPAADVLQNMLYYAQRVRAVPDVPSLRKGWVDLVRPETVVRGIMSALVDSTADEEKGSVGGLRYLFESGDEEIRLDGISDWIQKKAGGSRTEEVEEISLGEWIRRAEEAGLSEGMSAVFRGLGEEAGLSFPRLAKA